MTPTEHAAFRAGIETARQMALTAAVTIEVRDDGGELRQQAAAAALQGLAEGLASTFLDRLSAGTALDHSTALHRVIALIAESPADSGTIPCPACGGSLDWIRDSLNGHRHGQCRTDGCLRWME